MVRSVHPRTVTPSLKPHNRQVSRSGSASPEFKKRLSAVQEKDRVDRRIDANFDHDQSTNLILEVSPNLDKRQTLYPDIDKATQVIESSSKNAVTEYVVRSKTKDGLARPSFSEGGKFETVFESPAVEFMGSQVAEPKVSKSSFPEIKSSETKESVEFRETSQQVTNGWVPNLPNERKSAKFSLETQASIRSSAFDALTLGLIKRLEAIASLDISSRDEWRIQQVGENHAKASLLLKRLDNGAWSMQVHLPHLRPGTRNSSAEALKNCLISRGHRIDSVVLEFSEDAEYDD